MKTPADLQQSLQRIETLTQRVEHIPEVRELIEAILALHGAALENVLEASRNTPLHDVIVHDSLLSNLLVLHGISTPAPAGFVPLTALTGTKHCEGCHVMLRDDHTHLMQPPRKLICSCHACVPRLLSRPGIKHIPNRVLALSDFQLAPHQWENLNLPVGLVFFVESSVEGRTLALYPGPAGATESLLPLDAWAQVKSANPILSSMQPDVEALLVDYAHSRFFLVPIDKCFHLIGLIRRNWQGFGAGPTVETFLHSLECVS